MNHYEIIHPETKEVIGRVSMGATCKYATTYYHPIMAKWILPCYRKTKQACEDAITQYADMMKFESKKDKWTKEQIASAKKSLQVYTVTVADAPPVKDKLEVTKTDADVKPEAKEPEIKEVKKAEAEKARPSKAQAPAPVATPAPRPARPAPVATPVATPAPRPARPVKTAPQRPVQK
jgi:hypothetical protein